MNTVAIDRNTLNSLFDNQKKLDEIFDSIFDDKNYFIDISSPPSQTVSRGSAINADNRILSESRDVKESGLAIKQTPFFYVLPIVLEIAVIYLVVTNLL